ncbi:Dyp-type peroxidase [Gordonia neofelifaecis]|uniref:Peroxidase n=1 Tax=Gordonia neofelifaecis NRRL B-59395 TaxID=644548 RepID=F1YPS8_9ACTN|nr:Dyp-type peroxidase [Gordonia neofelifaecis]EGD53298.1 peroxidase [Gordonia neofelifaecis NRRL B-59395]
MTPERTGRISRRTLLAGGAGLAGVGIGAAAGGVGRELTPPDPAAGSYLTPFYGDHQSGITTPGQAHAQFIGLDLVDPTDVATLAGVLRLWTQDASRLTQGAPSLSDTEPELGTRPTGLTVTIGVGDRIFRAPALAPHRPSWLKPLPPFAIDRLDPRWGQTDLLLQIGSDDPVALAHATRMLTASVRRSVRVRWVQRGFRNSPGMTSGTMRNLFGQVDGTVQPASATHDDLLWDDGSEQSWMAGGTSLVLRRIAMHMDTWEALDRRGRELSTGRTLDNGAPLTGAEEFDEPDFTATRGGIPVIPASSHIARAHRRSDAEQFLRRGFNYDDPPEPGGDDTSNSGLIFAAYQRNPLTQYVPVQQRLAEHDDLNEWTTPIGSSVYAILPGAGESRPLGASLFAAAGRGRGGA